MGQVLAGLALAAVLALAIGALVAYVMTRDDSGDGMTILGQVPRDTDAGDSAVIDQLRKAGSDLSRPTDVTLYLYIPAEHDARAAAASLRKRGFNVEVHSPLRNSSEAASDDWGVIAQRMEVPSLGNLRKSRALFQSLATKYHGIYDGWEASVVK